MTHLETIQTLTKAADEARGEATIARSKALSRRHDAASYESSADAADLRATAYEESIDALQALSTMEATA